MPATVYAGVQQFDNWSVTISGRTYRCSIWIDDGRRTVESRCCVVQASGAEVELFRRTVYTVTADYGPDCPKIVASGNVFVVHFLEGAESLIAPGTYEDPEIRRVTFDMSAFESAQWTDRGTMAVGRFMHDLRPVLEHASDFLIAYVDDSEIPHMRRFDGLDWVDIAWTADAAHACEHHRALSCYAHDADNDAIMVYERVGAEAFHFWVTRADASTGTNTVTSRVLASLPDSYLWQARFCRWAGGQVNLVVESGEVEDAYQIPMLSYQRVDSGDASVLSLTQGVYHLRMLGEPFSYAGSRATDTEPNCYVLVGYTNVAPDSEFLQRNAFVLDLFAPEWANADAAFTIRPRPMWVGNLGDFDCRNSGASPDDDAIAGWAIGRRTGHVSSASPGAVVGPTLKTRSWAVGGWAKLVAMSSSGEAPLQPMAACGLTVRFQVEEPTQAFRDGTDPDTPDACYHGLNRFTVGAAREAGGGAVIGGGCMYYYDHSRVFEVGYCWHPEIIGIGELTEGDVADGTYLYTVTFEQRDALGQLHRSAPALPVSYAAIGGGEVVQVLVNTQTLSLRDNTYVYPGAPPINAVLWRTEAGGTVFYRVNARYNPATGNRLRDTDENDPTLAYTACQDNVQDASLVQHETLPFVLINGAWTPLPPFQPPAASCIEKWQNRIWLASSQDPRVIYYSQEMLPEQGGTRTLPPEFNSSLVVRSDGIGTVIALHAREEELLVYTTDAVYSITGLGADGAGNDASYQLSFVTRSAGTIEPRSLVSTPAGTFAQTMHGLYCLRGGEFEYLQLGAHVADVVRTGGNLRAATYLRDRGAVRWVTNGAVEGAPLAIELDLLTMRWSVHPLAAGDLPGGSEAFSAAVGGCSWLGDGGYELHVVVQQGAILIERTPDDDEPYADENRLGSRAVPLRVRLRPIHLDGIDGFVLLRRVGLAFEKPDDSAIRVTHYAWRRGRYEDVVGENRDYPSPALERPRPYGPRQQKCAAFWIDIQELADPEIPATENLRILGMHIEAGIKRGLRKA